MTDHPTNSTTERFCKDCRHLARGRIFNGLWFEKGDVCRQKKNPVTGEVESWSAYGMRTIHGPLHYSGQNVCGPSGLNWEPK